jgi:protein-L-isoaspartate(D-aspartate) O-methyltransferase
MPIAKRRAGSHLLAVRAEGQERAAPTRAEEAEWLRAREELVRSIHGNVKDPRLLAAFRRVPRHRFVPEGERGASYRDSALPIGFEQTISQPSMLAIMLAALALEPDDRVLEIGAGSGYAAALLAELTSEVYTIEIVPELAAQAAARLSELGYANAHVAVANGRLGLAEHAPYAKILVSAGASDVPAELLQQLATGGRIAIPVGDESGQTLLVGHKDDAGHMTWLRSVPCIFVPLVERR